MKFHVVQAYGAPGDYHAATRVGSYDTVEDAYAHIDKTADRLGEWRDALRRNVTEARGALDLLLAERLLFTPTRTEAGEAGYNVTATLALGRICSGMLVSQGGTSPTGFAASWIGIDGVSDYLRAA